MSEFPTLEERLLTEHFPNPDERNAARRRLENGEPLAYILGEWYFYDEVYFVSEDVLIPQPDTEILVEELIRRIPKNTLFLDLCTGSGCVAISVLAHRPDLRAIAVDISEPALCLARKNAVRNGVSERVEFRQLDVFKPAPFGAESFSVVCSNPPYINTDVVPTLSREVLHEPLIALDGGKDGMDFYRAILTNYRSCLSKQGGFLFEIGYDQAEKISALAYPDSCTIRRDYGGNNRVAVISVKN